MAHICSKAESFFINVLISLEIKFRKKDIHRSELKSVRIHIFNTACEILKIWVNVLLKYHFTEAKGTVEGEMLYYVIFFQVIECLFVPHII